MLVGIDLRVFVEPNGSGVATYTKLMLESLFQIKNNDINWVVYTSGLNKTLSIELPSKAIRKHIFNSNRLLNYTSAFVGKPSVGQCYPGASVIWQPNPLFISDSKVPLFVTIHDLSFVHFPQFFPFHTKIWYLKWVKSWLKKAPKNVTLLAVSEFTKRDILETFPQWEGRVEVVSPCPPVVIGTDYKIDDESILNSLHIKKPYILSLSNVEERKNPEAIIAGFLDFSEKYPDYDLVFAGNISIKKVNKLKRSHKIHFLGYVSTDERYALLKNAFCLAYPSFYEGYGYPPLEAMGFGVPVCAASVGALPETLNDAALWVDPYRAASELSVLFTLLADSKEVRERYIAKGKERVNELRQSFSPEKIINIWKKFE